MKNSNEITTPEMERITADIVSSPEKARAFLQEVGIIDEAGYVTPAYSEERYTHRWGDSCPAFGHAIMT